MHALTRRSFLAGATVIPFALWHEKYARARDTAPLVRCDARSTQGQAMLRTYAKAVAAMKNTPEGDPRSWVFQWYTHWVGPKDPNLGSFDPQQKTEEMDRIYPNLGAWRTLANDMWDTCQAHGGGDENFFLPWHRMFVYFFEKIIRSVAADESFTLPYWDYTTQDSSIHSILPPEFRQQDDQVLGPLYVAERNGGVNQGEPMPHQGVVDPINLDDLAECTYEPSGAQMGFCMRLDQQLHGAVHVGVGNRKNMGAVPWAARDPIFWLHHSNIDRLWASWNDAGRTNPTLAQTFVFADIEGNRVVADVKDFMDLTLANYRYDRLEPAPACPQPQTVAALAATAQNRKRVAMAKATPVRLGPQAVTVPLEALPEQEGTPPTLLPARVRALAPGKRLFLVIKNLQTEVQPGVVYELFLDLPQGATKDQSRAHYVGALNFFHAMPAGHGHGRPAGPERFTSFDITDLARRLQTRGVLAEQPRLTITPAGTPADDAKPVIGEITLVEQ
jgi:tyrosinase